MASARTNLNTPGADFTLTMEKDDTLETATVQESVQESYETSRDIEVRGSKIIPAVKPEEETFTATIKGEEGFLTEEEKEIRIVIEAVTDDKWKQSVGDYVKSKAHI